MDTKTAVGDVAKKKTKPKSQGDGRKPLVIQIRGNETWKEAIVKLAEFEAIPIGALFDRAVRRYAKEVGFPGEIPPR